MNTDHGNAPSTAAIAQRVEHIDWKSLLTDLDDVGVAAAGPLLRPAECDELIDLHDDDQRFRSTVDMARRLRRLARPGPLSRTGPTDSTAAALRAG